MSMLWIAVIAASVLSFAQKWIGYQAPQDVLEGPRVSRITTLLPVALLGALVATQAAASGTEIVLDARLAGLAAAVVLLVLRAPVLVVVVGAAVVAAGLRARGWACRPRAAALPAARAPTSGVPSGTRPLPTYGDTPRRSPDSVHRRTVQGESTKSARARRRRAGRPDPGTGLLSQGAALSRGAR